MTYLQVGYQLYGRPQAIVLEGGQGSNANISFNGFGLRSNNIVITDIKYNGPLREREGFNNANYDGVTKVTDFFRTNTIVLTGYIFQLTGSDLETFLDNMTATLSVPDKYLLIQKFHKWRRYLATWKNTDSLQKDRRNYMQEFTPFELVFEIDDPPFGEDLEVITYGLETQTASSLNQIVRNSGSVDTYLETLVRFNSASGVTGLTLSNSTTGESVTLTRNISGGDLVEFNSNIFVDSNGVKTGNYVKVNGVIDNTWSGVIPTLTRSNSGINNITLSITSSSHSLDAYFNFRQRYLF